MRTLKKSEVLLLSLLRFYGMENGLGIFFMFGLKMSKINTHCVSMTMSIQAHFILSLKTRFNFLGIAY